MGLRVHMRELSHMFTWPFVAPQSTGGEPQRGRAAAQLSALQFLMGNS